MNEVLPAKFLVTQTGTTIFIVSVAVIAWLSIVEYSVPTVVGHIALGVGVVGRDVTVVSKVSFAGRGTVI